MDDLGRALQAVAKKMGFEMEPVFTDEHAPKCYWQKIKKRDMKFSKDDLDDDRYQEIWEEYGEVLEKLQDSEKWKEWILDSSRKAWEPESFFKDTCCSCGKNEPVYFHGEEKEMIWINHPSGLGRAEVPKYPKPSKEDDNYWHLWLEVSAEPLKYCNTCQKKVMRCTMMYNGWTWMNNVQHHHHHGHDHDSDDLHHQWQVFHDYIKDNYGDDVGEVVNEDCATHCVQQHGHHCCVVS